MKTKRNNNYRELKKINKEIQRAKTQLKDSIDLEDEPSKATIDALEEKGILFSIGRPFGFRFSWSH